MPATILETLYIHLSSDFYETLENINPMSYIRKGRLGKRKSLGLITQPATAGLVQKLKSIHLPALGFPESRGLSQQRLEETREPLHAYVTAK